MKNLTLTEFTRNTEIKNAKRARLGVGLFFLLVVAALIFDITVTHRYSTVLLMLMLMAVNIGLNWDKFKIKTRQPQSFVLVDPKGNSWKSDDLEYFSNGLMKTPPGNYLLQVAPEGLVEDISPYGAGLWLEEHKKKNLITSDMQQFSEIPVPQTSR